MVGKVTPSEKVRAVLERCSRDRWLPPKKVKEIAMVFARRYSGAPSTVYNAVLRGPCAAEAVGMYKGKNILNIGDPEYGIMVRAVEEYEKNDDIKAAIKLLETICRSMK